MKRLFRFAVHAGLAALLWLPGQAQTTPLEQLVDTMVKADRQAWDKLIGSGSGIQPAQYQAMVKRAMQLASQGQEAQAWTLLEATDYVHFVLNGKREYTAPGQQMILRSLEEGGRANLAVTYAQQLVKAHPDSASAHRALGTLYCKTGNLPGARQSLEKSIELAPRRVEGYLWLGQYYLLSNDNEGAKQAFRQALKVDPDNATARDMLKGLDQPGLSPGNDEAKTHFAAAEKFFREGRYRDSLEEYALTLKADPKFAKAKIYMGDSHLQLGNIDKAIECYREAIVMDPKDRQAFRFLGDALEKRYTRAGNVADLDEAIAAFEKAVAIDPDYQMARQDLERARKLRAQRP